MMKTTDMLLVSILMMLMAIYMAIPESKGISIFLVPMASFVAMFGINRSNK